MIRSVLESFTQTTFNLAAVPRPVSNHASRFALDTDRSIPPVRDSDVPDGIHINAIGSFLLDEREVPPEPSGGLESL